MALSAATLSFLGFVVSYLNQCPLYDRSAYQTRCDLFADQKYDYIIVGGGTAGTTLASRLSENRKLRVLLIEAGDVPSQLSEAPATFFALQGTDEDWQYKTAPGNYCLGLKNQQCNWPQGKALGGGSTINAMLAIPGLERDYKEWVALGNKNWGWDKVKPYFDKAFKQMQTSTYTSVMPTRNILLAGAADLELPVNNPDSFLGYEDINMTINANQRYNTAKAYIVTANKRSNLCVMTKSTVAKILFNTKSSRPKAIGVQLTNGKKYTAQKEVIISAGAVNTPKLLKLSGIGPRKELQEHKIPTIVNLPGVGQNLQDHFMFPGFFVKFAGLPLEANLTMFLEAYCATKEGPIGQIDIAQVVGWINTRNDSIYPDIQFMHMTLLKNDSFLTPSIIEKMGFNDETGDSLTAQNVNSAMMIAATILSKPKSRGQVLLASSNINDPPVIHPGYLTDSDDHDVETMQGAIDHLNKLISTPAFKGSEIVNLVIPNCQGIEFNTPDFWKCAFRNLGTTLYHPSGTCKMGNDRMAVVNESLKVHKVQNLRVVDASIMPTIVTGNTNLLVIAIAEKAADMLKSRC